MKNLIFVLLGLVIGEAAIASHYTTSEPGECDIKVEKVWTTKPYGYQYVQIERVANVTTGYSCQDLNWLPNYRHLTYECKPQGNCQAITCRKDHCKSHQYDTTDSFLWMHSGVMKVLVQGDAYSYVLTYRLRNRD